MFAIFVEGGGADDLELAAAEGGLEDIGGVDAAAGGAGADKHMDFVYEEDGAAVDNFFDNFFESFFELAAVHGTGDEAADIEHEDTFVEQGFGHIAVDDALGQPFNDSGLADAGLADEGGIVFVAAAEDLDDALDFHLAADDGVEATFFGGRGQVEAELVDEGRLGFFLLFFFGLCAVLQEIARGLGADAVEVDAEVTQHVDGDAVSIAHEAEEQVFGADVVVAHHAGLFDSQFDNSFCAWGEGWFAQGGAFAASDVAFDGAHDLARFDAQILEDLYGDAVLLLDEAQEQMFGTDMVMVKPQGLFLCKRQDSARTFREAFEFIRHGYVPSIVVILCKSKRTEPTIP